MELNSSFETSPDPFFLSPSHYSLSCAKSSEFPSQSQFSPQFPSRRVIANSRSCISSEVPLDPFAKMRPSPPYIGSPSIFIVYSDGPFKKWLTLNFPRIASLLGDACNVG